MKFPVTTVTLSPFFVINLDDDEKSIVGEFQP